MYIAYDIKNGTEYAKLCQSHWINGKDVKTYINLGRVIDKEKHIYKNRKRGLFSFDPETEEYAPLDENTFLLPASETIHPSRILNFGDVFFIDSLIRQEGLDRAIKAVHVSDPDTLYALIGFYILSDLGLPHAEDWYRNSYASLLYPDAEMGSQRLSEQLVQISSEDSWRAFFKEYFAYLERVPGNYKDILIDSTGLPNSAHMPLTAISTHNGKISNEIRLIFVTEQETGLPVYMRYVSGAIRDVSTISVTIKELKAQGIEPETVLMDAGYYSDPNIRLLHKARIHFICRLKENLKLFKELVSAHKNDLESKENLVKFGRRLVFIQREKVPLVSGVSGYAYVCMDVDRRADEIRRMLDHLDPKAELEEDTYEALESGGVFILISTEKIERERILPMYYTRQAIEQTFDISSLLPLRIQSEENLRGHLLITFIAIVIVKRIQYRLIHEQGRRDKNLNPISLLQNLGYQHCSVYENKIIVQKANAKANQGYRVFGMESPESISV